jgi:RNA polymerase sigma factor (sigma-70 family)
VSNEPFEQVVAEHGGVVLRVCRALLGPDDAEDAWSETFIAALRAYPSLRPASNIRGWLVTIAHRKALDQLRRSKRRPEPIGADLEAQQRPALLDDALFDVELGTALGGLAPKQRAAVAYHHLGGLPYAEIGELLGCSEAAARRSASDGIAALRTYYRVNKTPEGRVTSDVH